MTLCLTPVGTIQKTLRDGTRVCVRVASLSDLSALKDLFRRASPQSLRYRFFAAVACVSPAVIHDLVTVDYTDRAAVVAVVQRQSGEELIGIANYARRPGRDSAEVALMVDDRYQRRGLGKLLFKLLFDIAHLFGITRFEAEVLDENLPMLRMLKESGYALTSVWDRGIVSVALADKKAPLSV